MKQYSKIVDEQTGSKSLRTLSTLRSEALITDLQTIDVFNTFSKESNRTNHSLGKRSSYSK